MLTVKRTILNTAILILGLATILAGCDSANQDIKDLTGLGMPTPTEAAAWMFHRDPEKRRLGITLIANADFGGQPVYVEVYQKAVTDIDPLVRAAAAQGLGLHGTGADAELVSPLLKDHFPLTRWEAAIALQRLHNPAVIPDLIAALRNNDEENNVKRSVATALGQYAEPRVFAALTAALDDRSLTVNQHARRSLEILTGADFGTERSEWLAWQQSTPDIFAGQRVYHYPVYSRKRSWYEKLTPLGAREFETPGQPRKIVAVDPKQQDLIEPVRALPLDDGGGSR